MIRRRKVEKPDSPLLASDLAKIGMNLLKQSKWSQAEPVLRECLAIRQKALPDDWSRFNTTSQIGAALLGQSRYAEAEALVIEGYMGMKARAAIIPPPAKAPSKPLVSVPWPLAVMCWSTSHTVV